jgi:hypothetical protein
VGNEFRTLPGGWVVSHIGTGFRVSRWGVSAANLVIAARAARFLEETGFDWDNVTEQLRTDGARRIGRQVEQILQPPAPTETEQRDDAQTSD